MKLLHAPTRENTVYREEVLLDFLIKCFLKCCLSEKNRYLPSGHLSSGQRGRGSIRGLSVAEPRNKGVGYHDLTSLMTGDHHVTCNCSDSICKGSGDDLWKNICELCILLNTIKF